MPGTRSIVARFWGAIPIALVIALLALRACVMTPPLSNLAPVASDAADPPNTHAYAGYVMIARGGPVLIGFQSAGDARLSVGDSRRDILGRGLMKDRIVLTHGPVAIRFAAPSGARLVWNPVGRRGDPEYLPASSLARTPDGFDSFAGTSPLDGVISLALLLVLVASLLYLARNRLRAVDRPTWIAMAAIFAGGVTVRWIGLHSFGQTWDEDVNWGAGRNYVTNLLSLDLSEGSWIWNFEHPPVMKYLDGIGAQFTDGFGAARALSSIWSTLGCILLVPIGTRLYCRRAGILAASIAALLPPLVAHGQIVGHESPTTLWWALAILLALGVHDIPERMRIRLAWVGVVIGVAVASRFVNALVGPLVLAIVIIHAPRPARLRAAIQGVQIMIPISLATFYVLWPRIWFHPIAMLRTSFLKLSQAHSLEPFLGVMTNKPGPQYFLMYLFATLPIVVLLGVFAYIVRATQERNRSGLTMLAWFVIPLGVMASPVRQDGVRYVMPCVLALAMAAGAGFDGLATRFNIRDRRFIAYAAAVIVSLLVTLARIHPYYLDYFGEQVGGPATVEAHSWFETAWWGEGVDRAVGYVNEHAAPDAKVFRNCIEPAHLAWFREDLWKPMTNSTGDADWIVTYAPRKTHCPIPPAFKKVFTVSAQGAPLAEVWTK